MAILDLVPGLEVTVCVDNHPLEEYNDDEEVEAQPGETFQHQASRTVSKYVESTTDKEFEIRYNITSAFHMDCPAILFKVFIDGMVVRRRIIRADSYKELVSSKLPYAMTINGVKSNINGMVVIKPFKFSEIKTRTDDAKLASIKQDSELLKSVGEICVRVYRGSGAVRGKVLNLGHGTGTEVVSEVHEKALKGQAKSHGLGFGEVQPASPRTWWDSKYLDGNDFPIAIFKFKYRSKEVLKQMMAIERSPEPEISPALARSITPSNDGPRISNETLKKMIQEELLRVLQGLVGAGESASLDRPIKRERGEDSLTGGTQKPKRPKHKVTVTVDLTADSDEEHSQVID